MNKKKELYIYSIIIIVSLLMCYPYFFNHINILDDMPFHFNRIMALVDNIKSGNILPSIYSSTISGYGYANGLFYPDLFIYIPALMVVCGVKLVLSYKIFMVIITVITGIVSFISIRNILMIKNNKKKLEDKLNFEDKVALLTTIVYICFPYRLIDIYIRGAMGEILVFIFIPIIIWGLYEIFYKENGSWKILTIGMTGVLFSHLITLFIMSFIVLLFTIANYKKIKEVFSKLLKATVFTIGLGAIFLFPMLEQMLSNEFYYNVNKPLGDIYENAFNLIPNINQYVLLALNILIIIAIILIYKKKKENSLLYYTTLILYLLLMTTNIFPWELISKTIPLISQIQFPWRLFMFIGGLIGLVISIRLVILIKDKYFSSLVLIYILFNSLLTFLVVSPIISKSHITQYNDYIPLNTEIGHAEYLPSKFDIGYYEDKQLTIQEINNKEIEYKYEKLNNKAIIEFKSKDSDLDVELPLTYYKGYKAYINDNELPLYQSDKGLITVNTDEYNEGTLIVEYQHTLTQIISYFITYITMIYFYKNTKKLDKIPSEII